MEKLSSTKPVPHAKKVGDQCPKQLFTSDYLISNLSGTLRYFNCHFIWISNSLSVTPDSVLLILGPLFTVPSLCSRSPRTLLQGDPSRPVYILAVQFQLDPCSCSATLLFVSYIPWHCPHRGCSRPSSSHVPAPPVPLLQINTHTFIRCLIIQ